MSVFDTKCPACGTVLQIQDDWVGAEAMCPSCQKSFVIQKDVPSAAIVATTSKTFTYVCPSCDSVAELSEELLGHSYECQVCFEKHIAEATTFRECPFCGKMVRFHATVCKHCKRDLTSSFGKQSADTFIFICPECEAVAKLPVSMNGKEYECKACCETHIAAPAATRKCPSCGEVIKINAKICKNCKKTVTAPQESATVKRLSDPAAGNRSVTAQDAETLQKLMFWFWICLGGSLVTCGLSACGAFVLFMIMLYKFWKAIPAEESDGVTPGKAVGFLFIPFFGLYWVYIAYCKLSEKCQNYSTAPLKLYALLMSIFIWSSQFSSLLANITAIFSPEAYFVFMLITVLLSLCHAVFAGLWLYAMSKVYLSYPRV